MRESRRLKSKAQLGKLDITANSATRERFEVRAGSASAGRRAERRVPAAAR
jgi:hypothetical protein